MIDIKISDKLKEKCPQLAIGCIEATVVVEDGSEELWTVINKNCDEIQEKYNQEDVLKIKNIDNSRKAYKALGKDPSRYRLSSESLVKRIVKGIGRGPINLENLPVFKDEEGYFGSSTSDSTRAMITESTTHILMNIISFGGDEELKEYMDEAIELLESFGNGKILEVKIIN